MPIFRIGTHLFELGRQRSIIFLWNPLKDVNLRSDPLENLFSSIRQQHKPNLSPVYRSGKNYC
jgi:hypothetical protein